MSLAQLASTLPEDIVRDFAADPFAPLDKIPEKAQDRAWDLYPQLSTFLESLPPEAIQIAFADPGFASMYGQSDRMARIWITDRLLTYETARRRLAIVAEASEPKDTIPYDAQCLNGINVDAEYMVRLANFSTNGSILEQRGHRFTICSTTESPNSTYWLLRSFHSLNIVKYMSVRLDPFLWGSSDSFPEPMYKMIVYGQPLDWCRIGRLRQPDFGQLRADKAWEDSEVTEYTWEPRDDGVHFICEELPRKDQISVRGARYLHAIYNPKNESITHFDGALRIYTDDQYELRRSDHVRKSGKLGVRRKVFRTDEPISRDTFSLIAQAFFVWNRDIVTYFSQTLPSESV